MLKNHSQRLSLSDHDAEYLKSHHERHYALLLRTLNSEHMPADQKTAKTKEFIATLQEDLKRVQLGAEQEYFFTALREAASNQLERLS